MKKILITGSEGRIGEILFSGLSKKYSLYGLGRRRKKKKNYFCVDLSDFIALRRTLQKIGKIDCIIHLAACADPYATWERILADNIVATRNIYECARIFSVPRMIFASSNHVTGGYEGNPKNLHRVKRPKRICVHDPIRPDNLYGVSKVFGEALSRMYYDLYGITSISLRIGAVVSDDDPTYDARIMKIWLSKKDLVEIVGKSIESKVLFGIYYATSKNTGGYLDIAKTCLDLDYQPKDGT